MSPIFRVHVKEPSSNLFSEFDIDKNNFLERTFSSLEAIVKWLECLAESEHFDRITIDRDMTIYIYYYGRQEQARNITHWNIG